MKEINHFRGKYFFLSNFYPCEFKTTVDELEYKWSSSEHAYQAGKFVWVFVNSRYLEEASMAIMYFDEILNSNSPSEAKKIAKDSKSLWHKIPELEKLHIMEKAVRAKFEQNDDLRYNLIETGDAKLVEGNNWGDTFWGVCDGVGQNKLGIILMNLREDLKNG